MPLGICLALVEEYTGLVDEVFVGEEPDQRVGLVASSGDGYALCACREEEQVEKQGDNTSFHVVKTKKQSDYC